MSWNTRTWSGKISVSSRISMESNFKKKIKVKLDLLADINMLLMVEKGVRGGIYHSIYRYEKGKNGS